jgi:hypothetical protein
MRTVEGAVDMAGNEKKDMSMSKEDKEAEGLLGSAQLFGALL